MQLSHRLQDDVLIGHRRKKDNRKSSYIYSYQYILKSILYYLYLGFYVNYLILQNSKKS